MKKLFFFASLLAIAVGCNKVETSAPEVSKTFTLISEISQTKVAVGDTGLMTWQAGDSISVFGHATDGSIIGPANTKLQDGAGSSTGKFSLSIDGTPELAVYPAGNHALFNGGALLVSLPATYAYADSVTNAPMIAQISSSEDLSSGTAVFKHVGGLVRVTYENVPVEAKSFILEATSGITGPFSIGENTEGEQIISANNDFGKTVSINITEADWQNTMSFYVPLPCGEYGFTVALKDAAGKDIEGSAKSVNSVKVSRKKFFKTPVIVLEGEEVKTKSGMIIFGTNDVKINSASVTGEDNLGNTWTVSTIGTSSFTTNADYYQVGSSSKPATSINFTTSLPNSVKITSFSAKFGGFTETAGKITLKVNDMTVGEGSLNASNDVTVTNTKSAEGQYLTVSITNIAKGVKCYYITYTYEAAGTGPEPTRPENEIFYESFDTNDGTGGNDGQWNGTIASNDIVQDNEGWEYVKGNGAKQCAKFGTSSALGSAMTPALGKACNATLTFKAAAWNGNSESTTLKLSVIGGGSVSPATVTLTKGAWNTFTATLTGITASSKVKFEGNSASNSRFFLDEVSVVKTGEPTTPASTLTISTTTNGSITATVDGSTVQSGAKIEEGKTVTISATANTGYKVKSVSAKKTDSSEALTVTDNQFVMPAEAVTVSAEFEDETETKHEYSLTIQTSDFNTTSYAANNGSHDFTAICTTDVSKKMTVSCTSNQIMQSSSVMQWQKNTGYIFNTTDLGTIKSVTVTSSAGTFTTYYGTSEHPTSGTTVGNGFFTVSVGGETGKTSTIVVVFEK